MHAPAISGRPTEEPSSRMFGRIRWRLTLWYSGVLAAALLVLGITLYATMQHALLSPVDDDLKARLQGLNGPPLPLTTPDFFPFRTCQTDAFTVGQDRRTSGVYLWACYDTRGRLLGESGAVGAAPHFADPSLALSALHSGPTDDTIDSGGDLGEVRRFAAPVVDGTGAVVGAVQVGRSIDDRVNALHLLLLLLTVLGGLALLLAFAGGLFLANRALLPARLAHARQRDFIADASHELRTPLTMLRADAEVLLRDRDNLSPDNVALVEDMVTETSHMAALATTMLDLARLDTSGAHLERDVVDLTEVAKDLARRIGPLASERAVTVTVDATGPVLVVGDRLLLEQAALVLIDNAVKYNREGGQVTVSAVSQGESATLEVRDTGIGIAAEHLPHLGERFYRVDKARSREMGGAGLGLSIVQTIAARHRGSFRLASRPEEGTVATLTLPAARALHTTAAAL